MKAPNTELFRLVRFAIKYPGWHSYDSTMTKHIKRAVELGLLEKSNNSRQFRLPLPFSKKDAEANIQEGFSPIN